MGKSSSLLRTDLVELDETDRRILRALQEDARASFKNIGQSIGVSEATVFVRVKKLQERGVLRGFKAIVDPISVGKTLTDEIGMIEGVAGTETVIVLRTVKEELGVIV